MNLEQVGKLLEKISPKDFAESWDNSGFNINFHNEKVTGILICLDVSPEVIKEAEEKGCNLIISHHPLLFHATKQIDSKRYDGACIKMLAERGISLYCAHTSMDSAPKGINTWLADIFSLSKREFIQQGKKEQFYEVSTYVPEKQASHVRRAMTDGGAGKLGEYSECTFSVRGQGTFRPSLYAHPYLGTTGELEETAEVRISAVCSELCLEQVLQSIRAEHPYEMPAISVIKTEEPKELRSGLGIIGELSEPMPIREILDRLKKALKSDNVRVAGDINLNAKRIAVCGGAAGDFAERAYQMGADLFITGEIKHNEYMEGSGKIVLVEAGHFDTEKCFCEIYARSLQKCLNDVNYNIAIYVTNLRRPYVNY